VGNNAKLGAILISLLGNKICTTQKKQNKLITHFQNHNSILALKYQGKQSTFAKPLLGK